MLIGPPIPEMQLFKQERRLKRLITLGGLEIGIQHQIVNALELSTHHPPTPTPHPTTTTQKK